MNEFGDYTTYLEIAFFMNWATAAWPNFTKYLKNRLNRNYEISCRVLSAIQKDAGNIGYDLIEIWQNRFSKMASYAYVFFRSLSLVVAIIILLFLLLSEHSTYICPYSTGWWFIALAPIPGIMIYPVVLLMYMIANWLAKISFSDVENSVINMQMNP